jgi:ribosomal protein L11 methyltransferase
MLTASHTFPKADLDTLAPLTELTSAALDVADTPGQPEVYTLTWFVDDHEKDLFESLLSEYLNLKLQWVPVAEDVDYVSATRANFPPLTVGPFFISRNGERPPEGTIGIAIPPNMAFGSGEHATTSGCLLALLALDSRLRGNDGEAIQHGLDVGAGSGILAIAAIKLLGCRMLCTDCDAPSVAIGQENAVANGVAEKLTYVEDATLTHAAVTAQAPYPLIFANILLEPLLELAPKLAGLLAPGGTLIVSGFTVAQGPQIHTRYTQLGLRLAAELSQGGWLTHTYGR